MLADRPLGGRGGGALGRCAVLLLLLLEVLLLLLLREMLPRVRGRRRRRRGPLIRASVVEFEVVVLGHWAEGRGCVLLLLLPGLDLLLLRL